MASLGIRPPDVEPKATEHVPQMLELIERLLKRGLAYVLEGDVYFEVRRFPTYGKLSGKNLDELEAGARVDVDERKRDPLDFALWKAAKPGEPSWPSPWGPGRPGRHIECSALAMQYLGQTLDFHAGRGRRRVRGGRRQPRAPRGGLGCRPQLPQAVGVLFDRGRLGQGVWTQGEQGRVGAGPLLRGVGGVVTLGRVLGLLEGGARA